MRQSPGLSLLPRQGGGASKVSASPLSCSPPAAPAVSNRPARHSTWSQSDRIRIPAQLSSRTPGGLTATDYPLNGPREMAYQTRQVGMSQSA